MKRLPLMIVTLLLASCTQLSRHHEPVTRPTTTYPAAREADYVIKDFQFHTGQTLPELRIHYRTFGTPRIDEKGVVRNAVLIMHGTGGSGKQFIRNEFAGELFGTGQLLDADKYFIILPDDIGHGQSSKP